MKQKTTRELLKDKFILYRDTKDEKVFSDILYEVDNLLVFFINKLRKRFTYIRHIPMEDLYQSSVISLYTAIITCTDDIPPRTLPCRIRAYMISEFKQEYSWNKHEIQVPENFEPTHRTASINTNEIDYRLIMDNLEDDKSKDMLYHYLHRDKPKKQMAEEEGVTVNAIYKRVQRKIKTLKETKYGKCK